MTTKDIKKILLIIPGIFIFISAILEAFLLSNINLLRDLIRQSWNILYSPIIRYPIFIIGLLGLCLISNKKTLKMSNKRTRLIIGLTLCWAYFIFRIILEIMGRTGVLNGIPVNWILLFISSNIIYIIGLITIIKEIELEIDNFKQLKIIIEFKNSKTGEVKSSPTGFSWTTLFFGFFPALFRADWKWAIIQFLLSCCTLGISNIVFAFIYNKLYIKDLFNKGFIPFKEEDTNYLVQANIIDSNRVDLQLNKNNLEVEKQNQTIVQQLKEFKELLDLGLITQEEFDKKKNALLK